jgi:hypothetical protein
MTEQEMQAIARREVEIAIAELLSTLPNRLEIETVRVDEEEENDLYNYWMVVKLYGSVIAKHRIGNKFCRSYAPHVNRVVFKEKDV